MNRSLKTVIAVVGPTAVGKTAMAIQLAKLFKTQILSADSRQCFQELQIGVARPTLEELQTVPHHFIASLSVQSDYTAADYETYALGVASDVFAQKDHLVLAGGTGLYIHAFMNGLDPVPAVDANIRTEVMKIHQERGVGGLEAELQLLDPAFAKNGEMKNPQRMMRALEVVKATGKSIFSYRSGISKERDFAVKWVGLELPRAELVQRIDHRVDTMIEAGWLEEARSVYPFRQANALQTVGYKELFDHLEGKCSLKEAIDLIKIATRQYAKRQMTWFKKNPEVRWFAPDQENEVIRYLSEEGQLN